MRRVPALVFGAVTMVAAFCACLLSDNLGYTLAHQRGKELDLHLNSASSDHSNHLLRTLRTTPITARPTPKLRRSSSLRFPGQSIVGRNLQVFWGGRSSMGTITGYHWLRRVHTVEYSDGVVMQHRLYLLRYRLLGRKDLKRALLLNIVSRSVRNIACTVVGWSVLLVGQWLMAYTHLVTFRL
eukprot:TRINITY_DN51864_c0_g1_i1.p1 TRINITY_DN51864_c0_g1~~TRINITY_DN51864_c0_g1_i1.p1  ORF type:complete len:183 (-),score=24.48 TRINITY_DN51864_c0_g1_i1:142-690(-)